MGAILPSSIQLSLRHRRGPLDLDIAFTLDAPWTALFAPSGAGKTTILRLIAGLDPPDAGRLVCDQRVLLDTSARIFVPAYRRGIGMVAQRPALFPHLSVLKNVQYGSSEPPDVQQEILKLCHVDHLTAKMPAQLSGGERQRVALARTVASSARQLLLLDEPFTGLESELRDQLIHDLRAWTRQRTIPVLLVTHDLGEVFAANAYVLRMDSGRIVASGPASEVLAEERDRLIQRLQTGAS
jgi:molybdate transport system ATP-binding protein